jgi:hypothetical protein
MFVWNSGNTVNCFTRNTVRDIACERARPNSGASCVDEIITHPMARTKKSLRQERPALFPHTFTLAPDVVETLQRLCRDASDFLGRSVSSSAIVRALVRQIDQQGPPAADALFLLVEKELKGGVMWGKKK